MTTPIDRDQLDELLLRDPDMPVHPAAKMFPGLMADAFAALVEDVQKNGQQEPILVKDGRIIDGQHRYKACRALGIEPRTEEWHGAEENIVDHVLSRNLHRRHLTPAQLAAIAVETEAYRDVQHAAKQRQREAGKTAGRGRPSTEQQVEEIIPQPVRAPQTRDEIAARFGVNARYIQKAKNIRDTDPKVFGGLLDGSLNIPAAKRYIEQKRRQANVEELGESLHPEAAAWCSKAPIGDDCTALKRLSLFPKDTQIAITEVLEAGLATTIPEAFVYAGLRDADAPELPSCKNRGGEDLAAQRRLTFDIGLAGLAAAAEAFDALGADGVYAETFDQLREALKQCAFSEPAAVPDRDGDGGHEPSDETDGGLVRTTDETLDSSPPDEDDDDDLIVRGYYFN